MATRIGMISMAIVLALVSQVGATVTGGIRCISEDMTHLSLDDAIHVSDVVFTGRITGMKEGIGGTKTATVLYYYAYKSDPYLTKLGLGVTDINNFDLDAEVESSALFCLVREPNGDLALQCMTPFLALASTEMGFANIFEALERIRAVGFGKLSSNVHAAACLQQ